MLYLVGHTKGGVGKTTIATNLAALLATPLNPVCIVDADEQQHSSRFITRRSAHPGKPRIDCKVLIGGLHAPLRALRRRYADVIVDAGGADSEELRSAARTVDVMLVPFAPSQNDLDGFDMLLEKVVTPARDYHPGLVVLAVPNKVETHPKRQDRLPAARDFIEARGMTMLDFGISLLPAPYNRSAETGLGVCELLDKPALRATLELLDVLRDVRMLATAVSA